MLTSFQLTPIVAEAKALWTQALGAGDGRLAALDSVQVVVGNLPQGGLGVTIGNLILIDADAAGYGWFVDGSLHAHIPSGQMDLLTVVAHELGNAMGIPEDAHETNAVTSPILEAGARHLPGAGTSEALQTPGSGSGTAADSILFTGLWTSPINSAPASTSASVAPAVIKPTPTPWLPPVAQTPDDGTGTRNAMGGSPSAWEQFENGFDPFALLADKFALVRS